MNYLKTYGWHCMVIVSLICGMLGTTLIRPSTHALATACGPLDVITTNGTCDMGVAISVLSGGLTMTNDANATILGASIITLNLAAKQVNFKFTANIVDLRGSTAGWKLQASTPTGGIVNGTTSYDMNLDGIDPSSTCVGSCVPQPIETVLNPITATQQTFESVGNGTATIQGSYTSITEGHFTLPANAPSGAYNGTITVGLVNSY
jgi:hypothetical protein